MSFEYRPGEGFGPFRFGMALDQILPLAGTPTSVTRADAHPGFDLVRDDWDDATRALYAADVARFVAGDSFDNTRPDMTFQDGAGLVQLDLLALKQPVVWQGIDLFAAKRVEVVLALAHLEGEVWLSGEDYFFPRAALSVTRPMLWKDYHRVSLFARARLESMLDFLDPDRYDAQEITGREK